MRKTCKVSDLVYIPSASGLKLASNLGLVKRVDGAYVYVRVTNKGGATSIMEFLEGEVIPLIIGKEAI